MHIDITELATRIKRASEYHLAPKGTHGGILAECRTLRGGAMAMDSCNPLVGNVRNHELEMLNGA